MVPISKQIKARAIALISLIVITTQSMCVNDQFFRCEPCADWAQDLAIDNIFCPDKIVRSAKKEQQKKYTIIVYMAADNDLYPFAYRNIEQMKQIGSNSQVNILVHFDTHLPGRKKRARRLYIEKNGATQIGKDMQCDSGSANTLIDTLKWAIEDYPSDILILDLWNHGSGDLNPFIKKAIDPSKLFRYNAEKNVIELDRSITFLDYIHYIVNSPDRGICFDETYGTYLDDHKLIKALKSATELRKKKIDIVACDACLMAGTGTAWIMHQFADILVASEEVSLGPGYDYRAVLKPLRKKDIQPREFAQHIVTCFKNTYKPITNDFTQSALTLSKFPALADNIDLVAQILVDALKQQKSKTVTRMLTKSRSRICCTHFSEPSYIDLWHLYNNMLKNSKTMQLRNSSQTKGAQQILQNALELGLELINTLVIANEHGSNHKEAHGISIYFPERRMHGSFPNTAFAQHNSWLTLVKTYLKTL